MFEEPAGASRAEVIHVDNQVPYQLPLVSRLLVISKDALVLGQTIELFGDELTTPREIPHQRRIAFSTSDLLHQNNTNV